MTMLHLAQLNIGRIRYSLDDPRMADFVNNLDRVNAIAEHTPGFVWRLQDDSGNATAIHAFRRPAHALEHVRVGIGRRAGTFRLADGPQAYLRSPCGRMDRATMHSAGRASLPRSYGRRRAARQKRSEEDEPIRSVLAWRHVVGAAGHGRWHRHCRWTVAGAGVALT